MTRIKNNDRFIPGGSMVPRFNPDFGGDRLNEKLGPPLPNPLVRKTDDTPVRVGSNSARRRMIGLPDRFIKD